MINQGCLWKAAFDLHTVLEHHESMRETGLKAFLHAFRVPFPVAIDRHGDGKALPLPLTMARWEMRGTPPLILIDRSGIGAISLRNWMTWRSERKSRDWRLNRHQSEYPTQ